MQQNRPCCSKRVGDNTECPYCKGFSIKHGKSAAQKQRYYCKQCGKTDLIRYTNKAYQPKTNKEIVSHLKESNSIRSISRIIQINTKTIIRRIITIANKIIRPPLFVLKALQYSEAKKIYTDKLPSYKILINNPIHRTAISGSNHIERKNLTLRTHLKRLNRRTICFSRSVAILTACLRIYFWS